MIIITFLKNLLYVCLACVVDHSGCRITASAPGAEAALLQIPASDVIALAQASECGEHFDSLFAAHRPVRRTFWPLLSSMLPEKSMTLLGVVLSQRIDAIFEAIEAPNSADEAEAATMRSNASLRTTGLVLPPAQSTIVCTVNAAPVDHGEFSTGMMSLGAAQAMLANSSRRRPATTASSQPSIGSQGLFPAGGPPDSRLDGRDGDATFDSLGDVTARSRGRQSGGEEETKRDEEFELAPMTQSSQEAEADGTRSLVVGAANGPQESDGQAQGQDQGQGQGQDQAPLSARSSGTGTAETSLAGREVPSEGGEPGSARDDGF